MSSYSIDKVKKLIFFNNISRPMAWPCLFVSLSVLLAGCSGTPAPKIGLVAPQPSAGLGQEIFDSQLADKYGLLPGDTISVNVFRETDLSAERLEIDPAGFISLPVIGRMQVTGTTTGELAAAIEGRLAGSYLRNPHVSVNVVDYGSHQVSVEGAVENPGIFPFKPGTRLSGAISLAKGPSRVVKHDLIAVFRQRPEGMMVARFDLHAMQQGTMVDPLVQPGDRVVVGTSALSQGWLDFLQSAPILGVFTRF